VGAIVGSAEGLTVGAGEPPRLEAYVGKSVGLTVGTMDGAPVGNGVAFPGKYVGSNDGSCVG